MFLKTSFGQCLGVAISQPVCACCTSRETQAQSGLDFFCHLQAQKQEPRQSTPHLAEGTTSAKVQHEA